MFRRIKTCLRRFVRTDPVLRGPLADWRQIRKGHPQMCPHCVAITPQRFIWSPENAVRIIVDLFLVLFAIAIVPITIFDLWRRCERCGGSFVGDGWRPPRRHRCAVCGYNLRGNTSGRCPECGWQIPRGVVPALDEQQGRHADP